VASLATHQAEDSSFATVSSGATLAKVGSSIALRLQHCCQPASLTTAWRQARRRTAVLEFGQLHVARLTSCPPASQLSEQSAYIVPGFCSDSFTNLDGLVAGLIYPRIDR